MAMQLTLDDAHVISLVRDNLRLLSELRSTYRSAPRGPVGQTVRTAKDAFVLLSPEMSPLEQEQLRVILLDSRNTVLDIITVYQGSVNTAVVRMAELYREAIIRNAPAVIIAHNHPSGDPEPSEADLRMTKQAAEAARLLDIELLDHIIIGNAGWVSLRERRVF